MCWYLTSLAKASAQLWQPLVVTSNRDLLTLLREHLEAWGYAVVEAGNASDGVALLGTSGAYVVIPLEQLLDVPRSRGKGWTAQFSSRCQTDVHSLPQVGQR